MLVMPVLRYTISYDLSLWVVVVVEVVAMAVAAAATTVVGFSIIINKIK